MFQVPRFRSILPWLALLVILGGYGWLTQETAASRLVRVGWYEHAPLIWSDADTGRPLGFYPALLEEIARREELRLEYVKSDRTRLLKDLAAGAFHLAVPVTITDPRKAVMDFSWPIDEYQRQVLGRGAAVTASPSADFEKKSFGALQGSVHQDQIDRWYQAGLIGGVQAFAEVPLMEQALLAGNIDYLLDDAEITTALQNRYPDQLKVLKTADLLTPNAYRAFPVAKDEAWLLNRINHALREMMRDGSFSTIYREHHEAGNTTGADNAAESGARKSQEAGQTGDTGGKRSAGQDSRWRQRLPRIEVDENYDARAILDNYFDVISSDAEGVRDRAKIDLINGLIRDGRREFATKLHRAQVRLNELLLLIDGQPQDAPYFSAFYYRQIQDLSRSFEQVRDSLQAYRQKFSLENIQMKNNLTMIQSIEMVEPELAWRANWIAYNFDSALLTQARWVAQIDEIIQQSDDFIAQSQQILNRGETELLAHYRQYFFQPFDFFGGGENVGGATFQFLELKRSFVSWLLALPIQWRVIIPDDYLWPSLMWQFFTLVVIAIIVTLVILRLTSFPLARYKRPYLTAWLGFFYLQAFQSLPSTNDSLFLTLAMLFLGLAITDYAWKSRYDEENAPGLNPFLLTIFSIALLDVMTDLLAPKRVLLMTLVLLGLGNLLWVIGNSIIHKQHRLDIHSLFHLSGLIWTVVGITAWLGYLYPALALAIGGGLVLSIFYAGTVITQNLLRVAHAIRVRRSSTASIISTLLIPLLWFALLMGATQWGFEVFNASWFITHLYNVDLAPSPAVEISLRTLVSILLVGVFLRFVLNWIHEMLAVISDSRQLDLVALNSTYLVVRYVVWILFILITLTSLHIDWDNLKWIVGGLSVGFGFALKDILENFFAGIIILLGKQVRPGDTIEFGSVYGKVHKINIRATFIKTEDNALIALPNSQIVSKEFRNWTLNGDIRRYEFQVGIAYDAEIQVAIQTLLEVMRASHYVLKVHPPDVLVVDFADSAILLKARFWIKVANRTKSAAALRNDALAAFRARGIVIAFPQMDVHLDLPAGGLALLPPLAPAPGAAAARA